MSLLTPWREELRALIPGGFLRLDRGAGLFVSDASRQDGAWRSGVRAMEERGFEAELTREGLLRIGATAEKLRSLWDSLAVDAEKTHWDVPLWALGRRLDARREPLEEQPREILYRIMKDLDGGRLARLDDWLRPCLAERQRKRLPLPAAGGRMILWAVEQGKGADGEC